MAENISEDEQLEAFKRWWKENGTSLVIGVVLAVGGYFGWQFWQTQQQQTREAASALYNDMMETGVADPGQTLSEADLTKVNGIAGELMDSYQSTMYANNAAMLLAKLAVDNNDLPAAESHLRWVLDNDPNPGVEALANLRLAIVLYSQDQYEEARQLVASAPDDSFTSRYAEVRGDILYAQEQLQDAKAEYQTALDNLLQSQGGRRDTIQMKITDIDSTLAPATNTVTTTEATTDSGEENAAAETSEDNTASEESTEESAAQTN